MSSRPGCDCPASTATTNCAVKSCNIYRIAHATCSVQAALTAIYNSRDRASEKERRNVGQYPNSKMGSADDSALSYLAASPSMSSLFCLPPFLVLAVARL